MSEGAGNEVLAFRDMLEPAVSGAADVRRRMEDEQREEAAFRQELNELIAQTRNLSEEMELDAAVPQPLAVECASLNADIDAVCRISDRNSGKTSVFPELRAEEMVFSVLAGLLSVMLDVVLVGTPELVKLRRGGEQFGGSVLTGFLRRLGMDDDGKLHPVLRWLSDKCRVPYDISAEPGVMTPNDHRLKSLAHDPFLGLFFAVADIMMGTTTCVGNDGRLTVLLSRGTEDSQKLLAVFYYIGHLMSDLCTARGLPVPGAFLTQFFTAGGSDDSLAATARKMYRDGYDLRHFASMSVPVAVKDLLITAYLRTAGEEGSFQGAFSVRTETAYWKLRENLRRDKMLLIANLTATAGNTAKFVLPPNMGNPCAVNLAQWFALIRSGIAVVSAAGRDTIPETVISNRFAINGAWEDLKKDG